MTLPTLFGCEHVLGEEFLKTGVYEAQLQKSTPPISTSSPASHIAHTILIDGELPNYFCSNFEKRQKGGKQGLHGGAENNQSKNHRSQNAHGLLFPRGLVQPEGSFRFSIDALLLARFLQIPPCATSLLDIGTGCGVVALSMLLNNSHLRAVALDAQKILLEATLANARFLGVLRRIFAVQCDVETIEYNTILPGIKLLQGQCDVVVANPPYRLIGTGREPLSFLRRLAFFGTKETLFSFCALAAFSLRINGCFGVIFPAHQAQRLYDALHTAGLVVQRVLPVYSLADKAPTFVLVEASKMSNCWQESSLESFCVPSLMPPLVLYEGYGKGNRLTAEAVSFCPELQCNQGA